jgi:hypothetical protein
MWWEKPPEKTRMGEWLNSTFARFDSEWDYYEPPGGQLFLRHDAVPVLIEMLSYDDSRVCRWAAYFLEILEEPEPKEAFPALLVAWQRYKNNFQGSEKHSAWRYGNSVDAAMCIYNALLYIDVDQLEAAQQAGVVAEDPDNVITRDDADK